MGLENTYRCENPWQVIQKYEYMSFCFEGENVWELGDFKILRERLHIEKWPNYLTSKYLLWWNKGT